MSYRTTLAILGFLLANLQGCGGPKDRHGAEAQAILNEFSKVCFEHAHEAIQRTAKDVKVIFVSRPSNIKSAWGGDIFFSAAGAPTEWAGIPTQVLDGEPTHSSGAYALRYTYVPITRRINGESVQFHGVMQQVVDLSSSEVIATRTNYLFGRDFNRSVMCLGANWYRGNDYFADRVFGPRYLDKRTGRSSPDVRPELYLKAKLQKVSDVPTRGLPSVPANYLPRGAVSDYDRRTIRLPKGSFYMPLYWNQEPIPIVGTIEDSEQYIFAMLPGGWHRAWPPQQILFMYRSKEGALIKSTFVQVPPGMEWANGWGINTEDISVVDGQIRFTLLGKKVRSRESAAALNQGDYLRRYDYVVDIPR